MHLFVVLEKMKGQSKQRGISLTEMIIVIAVIAVLSYFAVPAGRVFLRSFESTGGARAMISAAMASARAIAAREHRYAGIRFQKVNTTADPLKAEQYMIFVIHEPGIVGTWGHGFRPIEGFEPVRLPSSVGVSDFTVVTSPNLQNPVNPASQELLQDLGDAGIGPTEITDATSFSIIFSPAGKLVICGVNFTGLGQMGFARDGDLSGLQAEPSRKSFVIYDRRAFRQAYDQRRPWSGYLAGLVDEMIYVNPYTGTLINR